MRHNAQRTLEMQDCLPADKDSMGIYISLNMGKMVDDAYKAWASKRGISQPISFFSMKRKPKKPKQRSKKKKHNEIPKTL